MNSEHSPEPWDYHKEVQGEYAYYIVSLGRERKSPIVADVVKHPAAEADARRIIACVNACRGISTTKLIQAVRSELLIVLGNSEELRMALQEAENETIVRQNSRFEELLAMKHRDLAAYALNQEVGSIFCQKRSEELEQTDA